MAASTPTNENRLLQRHAGLPVRGLKLGQHQAAHAPRQPGLSAAGAQRHRPHTRAATASTGRHPGAQRLGTQRAAARPAQRARRAPAPLLHARSPGPCDARPSACMHAHQAPVTPSACMHAHRAPVTPSACMHAHRAPVTPSACMHAHPTPVMPSACMTQSCPPQALQNASAFAAGRRRAGAHRCRGTPGGRCPTWARCCSGRSSARGRPAGPALQSP